MKLLVMPNSFSAVFSGSVAWPSFNVTFTFTSMWRSSDWANRVRTFRLNRFHCSRFSSPSQTTAVGFGATGGTGGVTVGVPGCNGGCAGGGTGGTVGWGGGVPYFSAFALAAVRRYVS